MTSSLSFHCMICYEEFDTHTIYPVVMPCGHTYVCCICASKIDKCMECRTSLFKEIPTPVSNSNSNSDILQNDAVGYRSFTVVRPLRRTRQNSDTNQNQNHNRSHSHGGSPRQLTKERIPLPKNVVLMSLIESSQLVQDTAHNQIITKGLAHFSLQQGKGQGQGQGLGNGQQPADDDDREEDRIGIGADFATAACGTYAVKCKQGLKIVPKRIHDHDQNISRPRSRSQPRSQSRSQARSRPLSDGRKNHKFSLMDVEDDYDEDETHTNSHSNSNSNSSKLSATDDSWKRNVEEIVVNNGKKKMHNHADEIMLSYGDRVQVVSIVDNWAKLARGYGYVYLEHDSDLVKVGGTLDKAASIEAMIYSLSHCRNKLLEAKVGAESDAIALLKELQSTLIQEQDVTVIGAEAFAKEKRDEGDRDTGELRQEFSVSFSLNGNISGIAVESCSEEINPYRYKRERERERGRDKGGPSSDTREAMPQDHDDDDDSITAHQRYHSRSDSIYQPRHVPRISVPSPIDADRSLSFLNCGMCGLESIVSGDAVQNSLSMDKESSMDDTRDDGGASRASSSAALTMYNSDEMVQAAQEWRKRNGKEASEYTHIDFRTGLSGHSGVTSSQAHDHQQPNQGGRKLRMSAHGGLTPRRRWKSNSSPYLSFASFSSFG